MTVTTWLADQKCFSPASRIILIESELSDISQGVPSVVSVPQAGLF